MSITTNGDMGLTGKSIALVGSGVSLRGSGNGPTIDSKDFVVRIRPADQHLKLRETNVGSRTDIYAQNGSGSLVKKTINLIEKSPDMFRGVIICNTSKSALSLFCATEKYNIPSVLLSLGVFARSALPEIGEFYTRTNYTGNTSADIIEDAEAKAVLKPSTGLRAFSLLRTYDFDSMVIAGFDRFHGLKTFGRYYQSNRTGKYSNRNCAKIHNFDIEHEIMAESIKNDPRITVL